MADIEEIHRAVRRTKAEFFLAVDQKRWNDFARLFTEDAYIDYSRAQPGFDGPASPLPSIAAYVLFAKEYLGSARTVHLGSVPIIDVLGPDHARALWKMEGIIVHPADSGRSSVHDYGIYEEEYRRTDAGWRISSLTFSGLLSLPITAQ